MYTRELGEDSQKKGESEGSGMEKEKTGAETSQPPSGPTESSRVNTL